MGNASGNKMPSENVPAGHRKRLREKFIKGGLSGFADVILALNRLGLKVAQI
jgi:hypothetical protein